MTRLRIAIAALFAAGCTKLVPVRPSELAKLSQAPSQTNVVASGSGGTATASIVNVFYLEAPDGRLVAVTPPRAVIVTPRAAPPIEFTAPIVFETNGDDLKIRSGNYAAKTLPLADITDADVVQFDMVRTMFASCGAAAIVPVVGFAVMALTSR